MNTPSPQGMLHRHKDGREHRHFAAGFEIGGQVIPDNDGSEPHQHGTLNMASGDTQTSSGPVVAAYRTIAQAKGEA